VRQRQCAQVRYSFGMGKDCTGTRKRHQCHGQHNICICMYGQDSLKRLAKKREVTYSFLFARPDGDQLAEIGELLKTERIRPVIDKVFPFAQAKEALEYLAQGRAKGRVVVQIK
jgi:NADPH:quinone reductase-like Zn-dependent oxidoreductase